MRVSSRHEETEGVWRCAGVFFIPYFEQPHLNQFHATTAIQERCGQFSIQLAAEPKSEMNETNIT